jgi:hypothetical protein
MLGFTPLGGFDLAAWQITVGEYRPDIVAGKSRHDRVSAGTFGEFGCSTLPRWPGR